MSSASIRETVARILVRLLEAYSPSGREEKAIEVFKEAAEELGFHKIWTDEAGNAHASTGNGQPKIVLVGHIDTVPGIIPVSRRNGVIRGRGAVDAKGPLAAFLVSASLLNNEHCTIQVSALVGEEADSRGAKHLRETGFHAPYMLIGEPTNTTGIAIGYRGSLSAHLECKGLGGHTSSPEIGDSALEKLLNAVGTIKSLTGDSVAIVELHARGPANNVLPTHAEALLDIRLGREVKPGELERIQSILGEVGCAFTVKTYVPPVRVKPQEPVPRVLVRSLRRLGLKPRILVKKGTSDMNLLYPCCTSSIAAYGPGDPSLSHTYREYISEASLETSVVVLLEALEDLCSIFA